MLFLVKYTAFGHFDPENDFTNKNGDIYVYSLAQDLFARYGFMWGNWHISTALPTTIRFDPTFQKYNGVSQRRINLENDFRNVYTTYIWIERTLWITNWCMNLNYGGHFHPIYRPWNTSKKGVLFCLLQAMKYIEGKLSFFCLLHQFFGWTWSPNFKPVHQFFIQCLLFRYRLYTLGRL